MVDRSKVRGNQFMIDKVFACVDAAGDTYAQHQRDKFRDELHNGRERRSAAQEKRLRKQAKRLQQG